ncbi:MAG: bacteriohemerythrin [Betaproteobacteria bacterium]
MALLSWSTQYLIGNDTIDDEHKELFRLINTFHDHWMEKRDRHEIVQVLNQLIAYAQMHFQHEESIMQQAEYPKLAEHQQIHDSMVETIFTLQQSFEDKDIHFEMDTMKFVKNWMVGHILENDYLFRDFLSRKSSTGETSAKK